MFGAGSWSLPLHAETKSERREKAEPGPQKQKKIAYGVVCLLTPGGLISVRQRASAIDLAAMADLDHFNDSRLVVDRVDDSIGALADTIPLVVSGELLAPGRARNLSEAVNARNDSNPDGARFDSRKLLRSGRLDEDAIACHVAGVP